MSSMIKGIRWEGKTLQNRNQLFDFAVEEHAPDIHICAGAPVQFRIGGKLKPVTEDLYHL